MTGNPRQLALRYGVAATALSPRYNVAPTQDVPALVRPGELVMLRWGLVPAWAKDLSIGNRLLNARAETLERRSAFREALRTRRCLILADGFYEWMKEDHRRRPFFLRLKGGAPFAFAGLWDEWRGIGSCTIVTTDANAVVAPIHDRMPVIARPELEARWLDPSVHDSADLVEVLEPFPSHLMETWEVSSLVNNPDHEEPGCIETLHA